MAIERAPRRGLMLVISSPSGAGKTSLSRRLVAGNTFSSTGRPSIASSPTRPS